MKTILALTLALLIWNASAEAADLLVAPDGTGPYTTIQDALDNIGLNDTVVLMAGTYSGPDNRNMYSDGTTTIRPQFPGDEVIIDLQGSAADPAYGITVHDGTLTLEGLTFRHSYGLNGSAVRVIAGALVANSCYFLDNSADRGGAISCDGGDRVDLDNCVLAGNSATVEGGAIYANVYADIFLTNCTLFMNECDDGSAVFRRQEATLDMESCLISYGRGTNTFSDYYGGPVTVANTNIWRNEGGDWAGIGGSYGTNGNIWVDPQMCDPMGGNFALAANSPCYVAPVIMGIREHDLSWSDPIYGLKADGTGMYPTIQEALNDVPLSAGITLEDGTFEGPGNIELDFMGKKIDLNGRSVHGAVIDALSWDHAHRRAIWLRSGEPQGTRIRNIQIKRGTALSSTPSSFAGAGGGVLVSGDASVSIENVYFSNNYADLEGSAVAMLSSNGKLVIDGGLFSVQDDVSAIYAAAGEVTLDNVSLTGGGTGSLHLANGISSAVVTGLQVDYAHGIRVVDVGNSSVRFAGCQLDVTPNMDPHTISGSSDVRFENCNFAGTGTPNQEHIRSDNSYLRFSNCNFLGDPADVNVAAVTAVDIISTFYRTTFTGFQTAENRGTLDHSVDMNSLLNECSFTDCATGVSAANSQNNHLNVAGTTFDSVGLGVVVSGTPIDGLIFTDSEFLNCGRGIDLTDSPAVNITGCGFRGTSPGSPVRATNSILTVSGSQFHDAVVTDSYQQGAGGIFTSGGSLTVSTSEFLRNAAVGAGGVSTNAGGVTIDNCLFRDNTSTGYLRGGAVSMWTADPAVVRTSRLDGNTSYDGGGISSTMSPTTIADCEIVNNTAAHYGGGLYLNAGTSFSGAVTGCQIAGNSAPYGAGVKIQEAVDVTFSGCTIAGNAAGAQVETNGTAILNFSNSIVAHGTGGPALQVAQDAGTPMTVACTDIYGNAGGDWVEALAPFADTNGNLSADPLFCDPATADFHLASDSPCLDNQNSCGVTMGALGVGCSRVSASPDTPVIRQVALGQNQPNPFNPSTQIRFELPVATKVSLRVYDVGGKLVRRLFDEGNLTAGAHQRRWDGRDDRGREMATGVYFYRLRAGDVDLVRKMALVR